MPQNYAKLGFMNFDSKEVTCICDTVHHVKLATGWTVRGSNPVGARFSAPVQTGPGGPPRLLYNRYRVFPRGKERAGREADPSTLLVPWSRKSRAIPLLPLWTVRPVQILSACTRVHFTFLYHHVRLETSAPRGSLLSASSDRGKRVLSVGYPNTKVISVRRTHHCGFQLPHST